MLVFTLNFSKLIIKISGIFFFPLIKQYVNSLLLFIYLFIYFFDFSGQAGSQLDSDRKNKYISTSS